jgi:putative addiction module component (TIGR02574 family)
MDIGPLLDKLTVAEKLRAMERLWDDLTRAQADVPSPAWHRDVLEARERRLAAGQERVLAWEKAKEDLRSRPS